MIQRAKLSLQPSEFSPTLWFQGEGGALACEREGEGVPIPMRGQTLWYPRYIYVLCGTGFSCSVCTVLGVRKNFVTGPMPEHVLLYDGAEAEGRFEFGPSRISDLRYTQRVSKRCRLSWLTSCALVYEPKCGGRGSQVSANEYGARIYRPSFHENKPKTLVFT
jgi:hypothetical protein